MFQDLKNATRRFTRFLPQANYLINRAFDGLTAIAEPHGEDGVEVMGHREYVGGDWEKVGQLQFEFMLERGLEPSDRFLEIACGSLRAGRFFIDYLEAENYMGIDKETSLIKRGLIREVNNKLIEQKRPNFVVNGSFDFDDFNQQPDSVFSHGLFTHLTPESIKECLSSLRTFLRNDGEFFATFNVSETPVDNPESSHDHKRFYYTTEAVKGMAQETGWSEEVIGYWGHPQQSRTDSFKNVHMFRLTPR